MIVLNLLSLLGILEGSSNFHRGVEHFKGSGDYSENDDLVWVCDDLCSVVLNGVSYSDAWKFVLHCEGDSIYLFLFRSVNSVVVYSDFLVSDVVSLDC